MAEWSYSEGEYGHRVRVYTRPNRGMIYISYWDAHTQCKVQASLKHANKERARQQCRDLSDRLRLGILETEPETIMEPAVPESGATPVIDAVTDYRAHAEDVIGWGEMFERYHDDRGRHKKGAQPREDRRRQKIWLAFVEKENIGSPADFDDDARDRFIRLRRKGDLDVPGVGLKLRDPKKPDADVVTDTTIFGDVVYLNTVLGWAVRKRVNRKRLLAEKLMTLPTNLKTALPKRPVAACDDLRQLRLVADDVDPQGLYGCFVRVHEGLGWRVTGACNIRISDVVLESRPGMPYGHVLKNPHVDKEGVGQEVPLSKHLRATFSRLLTIHETQEIVSEYIFPAPRNRAKPWSRWHVRDLMDRAQAAAAIPHLGGSHAVRRGWVNARKHHPAKDLMATGGWKDQRSLETYMQADVDTMLQVVSTRTNRIVRRKAAGRTNAG